MGALLYPSAEPMHKPFPTSRACAKTRKDATHPTIVLELSKNTSGDVKATTVVAVDPDTGLPKTAVISMVRTLKTSSGRTAR